VARSDPCLVTCVATTASAATFASGPGTPKWRPRARPAHRAIPGASRDAPVRGGIDALRYAGQRQLTRSGARELSPRNEQRRAELIEALKALRELKHRDCELRPRPLGA
jgi:hypothetical protein